MPSVANPYGAAVYVQTTEAQSVTLEPTLFRSLTKAERKYEYNFIKPTISNSHGSDLTAVEPQVDRFWLLHLLQRHFIVTFLAVNVM